MQAWCRFSACLELLCLELVNLQRHVFLISENWMETDDKEIWCGLMLPVKLLEGRAHGVGHLNASPEGTCAIRR